MKMALDAKIKIAVLARTTQAKIALEYVNCSDTLNLDSEQI